MSGRCRESHRADVVIPSEAKDLHQAGAGRWRAYYVSAEIRLSFANHLPFAGAAEVRILGFAQDDNTGLPR